MKQNILSNSIKIKTKEKFLSSKFKDDILSVGKSFSVLLLTTFSQELTVPIKNKLISNNFIYCFIFYFAKVRFFKIFMQYKIEFTFVLLFLFH